MRTCSPALEPGSPALRGAVRALRHLYGIEVPGYQLKVLAPVLERLGGAGGADAGLERLLRHERGAWDVVIDAITVPETYFFRHFAHFVRLAELATERMRRGRPCRVLSAGCSSGEEVWSAAAVLSQIYRTRVQTGCVVGWDVNARRLIEASEGRYREWSVRTGLHGYDPILTRVGDCYQVVESLKPWARFEMANLMAPLPEPDARFDAIFFRNVAIYFDPSTARAVFERIAQRLEPDGLIFVGPSDPVTLPQDAWEHVIADGVRVYRRVERKRESSKPPSTPVVAPIRALVPREPRPSPRPRLLRARDARTRSASKSPRSPRATPARTLDRPSSSPPVEPGLAAVASLADRGCYAEALKLLCASGCTSNEASKWEGVLKLNLGDPLAAVACFRRCVYLEPQNVAYRRWLAVAFEAAGMEREANRERRNARELGEP